MRALSVGLISLFFSLSVWADNTIEPLLNKVTLQFNAESWSVSKTALVNININAALSDKGLEKIHSQIMEKLNSLSNKGEWHLISYDRTQDKSGLESVQIAAQARLPETELNGLRDKAKAMSKPGETYTLDSIQFTPSEDEIRMTQSQLRDNIYQQIKAEIARLNRIYPEQKYYVHDVNFLTGSYPAPMAQTVMFKAGGESASRNALSVGDKLRLFATVVLAAAPDPSLIKAAQG